MDISAIIKIFTAEITAFRAAADKRLHLTDRVRLLYGLYIEPIDLPGPDAWLDPFLRALCVWITGRLYDMVAVRFEDGDEAHPPWPELPEAPETTEGGTP